MQKKKVVRAKESSLLKHNDNSGMDMVLNPYKYHLHYELHTLHYKVFPLRCKYISILRCLGDLPMR